jgi:hypothetical protein
LNGFRHQKNQIKQEVKNGFSEEVISLSRGILRKIDSLADLHAGAEIFA